MAAVPLELALWWTFLAAVGVTVLTIGYYAYKARRAREAVAAMPVEARMAPDPIHAYAEATRALRQELKTSRDKAAAVRDAFRAGLR